MTDLLVIKQGKTTKLLTEPTEKKTEMKRENSGTEFKNTNCAHGRIQPVK